MHLALKRPTPSISPQQQTAKPFYSISHKHQNKPNNETRAKHRRRPARPVIHRLRTEFLPEIYTNATRPAGGLTARAFLRRAFPNRVSRIRESARAPWWRPRRHPENSQHRLARPGPVIVNILAFHIFLLKGAALADPVLMLITILPIYPLWTARKSFAGLLN
jgi:hypothetical protein